jgi:hypothetical protein
MHATKWMKLKILYLMKKAMWRKLHIVLIYSLEIFCIDKSIENKIS